MYKTTILIPYRNRKQHLDFFLNNSVPLLQTFISDLKIVILQQSNDNRHFNRGALLNVGFTEYKNSTNFFITHDVDLNPYENTINTYYVQDISENQIKGIYTSASNTLGGIIKVSSNTIHKINGFPNSFWGWGVEDKALQNRAEFFNISISKNILNNDPQKDTYFKIFNDIDDRVKDNIHNKTHFEYNIFKTLTYQEKEKIINSSGLHNISYTILNKTTLFDNVELLDIQL
jgi:hypothetical protein